MPVVSIRSTRHRLSPRDVIVAIEETGGDLVPVVVRRGAREELAVRQLPAEEHVAPLGEVGDAHEPKLRRLLSPDPVGAARNARLVEIVDREALKAPGDSVHACRLAGAAGSPQQK